VTSNHPIQQLRDSLEKAVTQLEASLPSNESEVSTEELEMIMRDLESTTARNEKLANKYGALKIECTRLEKANRALGDSGEKLRLMRELLEPSSK
jgi:chromosome segregation ATPase